MTGSPGPGSGERTVASSPAVLRRFAVPIRDLLRTETASAGLLLAAAMAALVWANSPWSQSYTDFWHTELSLRLGGKALSLDLRHWVNDGLMVFFFFVLGLEVKRELVMGELTGRRSRSSRRSPASRVIAGQPVVTMLDTGRPAGCRHPGRPIPFGGHRPRAAGPRWPPVSAGMRRPGASCHAPRQPGAPTLAAAATE